MGESKSEAVQPERVVRIQARAEAGGSVAVQGWLRSARHAKGVSFLDLNDGSSMSGIQVVAAPELPEYETVVKGLGTGCAVRALGLLVESPGKGQRYEIQASRVELVGGVEDDYPLQKKRHSFEFLRTIAHLRPRTNSIGAVWRVRNAATRAIHDFFPVAGFHLPAFADHHALRCRGCRRDVSGLEPRCGFSAARRRHRRFLVRTSSAKRPT